MDKSTPFVAIVDDEAMVRRVIARVLRLAKIPAREYSGGVVFLEALKSETPGCVLLDIVMPDMNGMDVLTQIMLHNPNLPVILMSGNTTPSLRFPSEAGGFVNFLEKPFHAATLVETVKAALVANRVEKLIAANLAPGAVQ